MVPTIRILYSWGSYVENFRKFGHENSDVKLIVVDDFCPYVKENIKLLKSYGVPFEFWTIQKQKSFFQKHFGNKWKDYWHVIPHHTDACRSFGYLVAALWGADVIVTWDDDNWAINSSISYQGDYLKAHSIVNENIECVEVSSDKGWFNTCAMLRTDPAKLLYPRGYPYSRRGETYKHSNERGRVVMNVGLWIGNPDVDSITVLSEGSMNGIPKTRTVGLLTRERIMLAKGTYAPLNTANTAYAMELLPCIYDTFQGAKVGELKLDRYGDIWCNFFVKKIVDAVGGKIAIGIPLVEHRREPRNTMIDFMKEFWGMVVSMRLFEMVESIELNSKKYFDAYFELVQQLSLKEIYPQNSSVNKYFKRLFSSMNKWLEILSNIGIS